jgi:ADP-ribose pyrophosphatase
MSYQLLKSENVFSGRVFSIRRDTLRLPDNHETTLDIVEHVGSVVILPLDADGNLLFVKQYRHAAGMELLELPAGTMDAGETPEECASREIREETGMAADTFINLGGFYLAPGYSSEYMHVFLATDLRASPLAADADEFLSVHPVSINEALRMAEHGDIPDAKSLAAFHLAKNHLKLPK